MYPLASGQTSFQGLLTTPSTKRANALSSDRSNKVGERRVSFGSVFTLIDLNVGHTKQMFSVEHLVLCKHAPANRFGPLSSCSIGSATNMPKMLVVLE